MRFAVELPLFDELFADIAAGSNAEIDVVPGSGHGTEILRSPGMLVRVADWIEARLMPR